jgi:hypothetical protein
MTTAMYIGLGSLFVSFCVAVLTLFTYQRNRDKALIEKARTEAKLESKVDDLQSTLDSYIDECGDDRKALHAKVDAGLHNIDDKLDKILNK